MVGGEEEVDIRQEMIIIREVDYDDRETEPIRQNLPEGYSNQWDMKSQYTFKKMENIMEGKVCKNRNISVL